MDIQLLLRISSRGLACFPLAFSVAFLAVCLIGEAQRGSQSLPDSFARRRSSAHPYNARSCSECHSEPVIGGSSRRTVMRAGSIIDGKYVGVPEGGILHSINYSAASAGATIHGPRVTLNLLGDGYVEAVEDEQIRTIARQQAMRSQGRVHGEIVLLSPRGGEDSATKVVGRFGWKAQHASLLDASADALLNELGIANRVFPGGSEPKQSFNIRDHRTDELDAMVRFIRDSEPIVPDHDLVASDAAKAGSKIFERVGCSICHIPTLKTASPGTRIRGSGIVVSQKLGNREIHPYSDYLLHDVGTGDGVVQNVQPEDYTQSSATKFRTAPLWGLRFRHWMMHDGQTVTYQQAIMRHRGEALHVTLEYTHLTHMEQEELLQFLDSL